MARQANQPVGAARQYRLPFHAGAEAQIRQTFGQTDLKNSCTLVLAYPYRQEKLGAPNDIVSQRITVDHSSCVVDGVMPKRFTFYPKEANGGSLITPASGYARWRVQLPWRWLREWPASLVPAHRASRVEIATIMREN